MLLSVPPLQLPPMPLVFPVIVLATGFATSTPVYRETIIAAPLGASLKVAVTLPADVGVPFAIHTETPVWLRPAHCSSTSVQLNPNPFTDATVLCGLPVIAAINVPPCVPGDCDVVTLLPPVLVPVTVF